MYVGLARKKGDRFPMLNKKLVSFRLSGQTVAFLDQIKAHLEATRPKPWWGGDVTRTSALEFAAQQIAKRIEQEASEKMSKEKPPTPKKVIPQRKAKVKA